MSAIAAQTDLRDYAAREWPRLNHKGRLAKLCRALPWSDRRVRAVYNAEQGVSLRADEQAEIAKLTAAIDEANRETFRDLQSRIARLEAALFHQDEAFHSDQMAGLRQAVDIGRGGNVPRPPEPAE
jgi:hypothetical protein